jgi:hypothetical protein
LVLSNIVPVIVCEYNLVQKNIATLRNVILIFNRYSTTLGRQDKYFYQVCYIADSFNGIGGILTRM